MISFELVFKKDLRSNIDLEQVRQDDKLIKRNQTSVSVVVCFYSSNKSFWKALFEVLYQKSSFQLSTLKSRNSKIWVDFAQFIPKIKAFRIFKGSPDLHHFIFEINDAKGGSDIKRL